MNATIQLMREEHTLDLDRLHRAARLAQDYRTVVCERVTLSKCLIAQSLIALRESRMLTNAVSSRMDEAQRAALDS